MFVGLITFSSQIVLGEVLMRLLSNLGKFIIIDNNLNPSSFGKTKRWCFKWTFSLVSNNVYKGQSSLCIGEFCR